MDPVVPIVPHSSGEEGNTIPPLLQSKKQISPAKRWCLTLNNYTEEQDSSIRSVLETHCSVAIIGHEIGEQGTPHLQGYCEFKKKVRPMGLVGLKQIHWEKSKGSKASNVTYCSKEDKNAWCIGCRVKKPLKLIKEEWLFDWQKDIIHEIKGDPDDRKIKWVWSHTGKVGKTQFSKYLSAKFGAICLQGKCADVKNGVVQYITDTGDRPPIVLWPIPRCGNVYSRGLYEGMENVKDMYFYSGKYEGGQVNENTCHLIVFANEPPRQEALSEDRWDVIQLPEEEVETR